MRVVLAPLFALVLGACANGQTSPGAPADDATTDGGDDTTVHDVSFDVPPQDSSTLDASYLDGDLPDGACAAVKVDTKRTTPNVFFIIDQSGSMIQPFPGSGSKWQAIEDALVGTGGVIPKLQDEVRFGALMFMDDPDIAGCPDIASTPAILHGLDPIGSLYAANSPGGNTPTGDSIAWATTSLDTIMPSHTASDPSIFVLATDGEPATCADSTDVPGGRKLTVDNVTAAHAAGVDTYVISVGVGIATSHLQDVANAGVGVPAGGPDAPYWVATDLTGFEKALTDIVGGVISCTVELVGHVDPARACEGTVTLDGTKLTCGTDWKQIDSNHIELLGAACDKLKSTSTTLEAEFPCDVLF